LINYNKALLQRNVLLKKFAESNYFDVSALEIWDQQLVKFAEKIYFKRKEFLEEFQELFQYFFDFITKGKEQVEIQYLSQLTDRSLEELLSVSRDTDRQTRFTNSGIHKDDLLFNIDHYPLKRFGSQGQQKSFVVAVKLAQFEYTRKVNGFKPIVLLDDIFDKLDENRVKQIIELVSNNNFGQTFITDTKKERVENIFRQIKIDNVIFEISDGVSKLLTESL